MHNQETAVVNHDTTKETENRIDENKLDTATVNLLLDRKVRFLSYKITQPVNWSICSILHKIKQSSRIPFNFDCFVK